METYRIVRRGLILTSIVVLALSVRPAVESAYGQQTDVLFGREELSQMVAPIALYPDSLIAHILIASTYPLEVVEAKQWLDRNKGLSGDDLNRALLGMPWDPSVKSLCHFPDVLHAMNERMDMTRILGDVFLAQEADVMAAIQELRVLARNQGHLRTTPQQQVIVQREIIRIEPPTPNIVYVPVYDPLHVYGSWRYPAYPPYYWHPSSSSRVHNRSHVVFSRRTVIKPDVFSWVRVDWPVRRIRTDIHKTSLFHRQDFKKGYNYPYWRHDPRHRQGVIYKDRRTRERFGVHPQRTRPEPHRIRQYPYGDDRRGRDGMFKFRDDRLGRDRMFKFRDDRLGRDRMFKFRDDRRGRDGYRYRDDRRGRDGYKNRDDRRGRGRDGRR